MTEQVKVTQARGSWRDGVRERWPLPGSEAFAAAVVLLVGVAALDEALRWVTS